MNVSDPRLKPCVRGHLNRLIELGESLLVVTLVNIGTGNLILIGHFACRGGLHVHRFEEGLSPGSVLAGENQVGANFSL